MLGETRAMEASETGSELRDAVISPGKVVPTRLLRGAGKAGNRPEDKLDEVRVDEEFRKRVEASLKGFVEIPRDWEARTVREQRDWLRQQFRLCYENLPERLIFMCVGSTVADDCDRSEFEPRPEWLEHEKCVRGQRFAMDNLAGTFFAQFLSLYVLFSFEHGLKPLIVTGKSSEPFTAFQRYLSTGVKVRNWYTSDIWRKDTVGYRDLQTVRKMHATVRRKMLHSSYQDIDEASKIHDSWSPARDISRDDIRNSCPAPLSGQCPYASSSVDVNSYRPTNMNQSEMAATQSGFVSLVILYPEHFGIHGATDDDLDAFCHLWRSIGYLLGVEDEFNFCSGSLEDVKERSRDFLEYWVKSNLREITPEWEHMLRCVTQGIQYYFPGASYEQGLLYLSELLGMSMPTLRASMSYISWLRYLSIKATFNWFARLKGFPAIMNRRLNTAIDRALHFTDKQLKVLRDKSNDTLSKGIAATNATRSPSILATPTHWHKLTFLVFSSPSFLFKFPYFLKELVNKLFRIGESVDYGD